MAYYNTTWTEYLYLKVTPNPGIEEAVQCSEKYTDLGSEPAHIC